jgi:hypothetical protein
MRVRKNQAPLDLRYFNQSRKKAALSSDTDDRCAAAFQTENVGSMLVLVPTMKFVAALLVAPMLRCVTRRGTTPWHQPSKRKSVIGD